MAVTPGLILRTNGAGTAQEFASYAAIGLKVGRVFEYDFAVDGGTVGTIPLRAIDGLGVLPTASVAQSAQMDIITALTSGGVALAALTTGQSAGDLVAATVVSGPPWSTTGIKITNVLLGTVGTQIKMTADRTPALVVSGADLTAGKFRVLIEGWQSA